MTEHQPVPIMERSEAPTEELLRRIDAYWRAANFLSVGQIYLLDNPLLRERLRPEHIKPRLLGHWGTTPGLNFIYAHLNRVIKQHDLNVIYITGPGHGGPGLVANAWLEGTYSEVYPNISRDQEGMKRLFKQFSFPGGIPSHVAPETPGSIHEGGELGYSLSHAFGAAFDNPDLLVACVVGDGEAETGPLATSWHSNKFLNPVHDGAVLPILHLNGYKIALGRPEGLHLQSPTDPYVSLSTRTARASLSRATSPLHGDAESSSLLPVAWLASPLLGLAPPLRSLLITRSSPLLRENPPPPGASILSPFVDSTYRVFSSHHRQSSHVLSQSPDQARATCTPGVAEAVSRWPLGCSWSRT